ncbi:GNAT family N-acetyltransferase [Kribbella sp. DT2]|uniref:GNAT family N-acetyltransferase n=1 Tax=Kribbella sp. DT2 TaxID=3393427 RepID=UPI003CED7A32
MLLIRPPAPIEPASPPAGITLRPPTPEDTEALGRTYFASYPPGIACATETEAIEDIRLTYAGEYGVLDLSTSRLAIHYNTIVAAALVVERAPWPDTPNCPFLIELFTLPTHRHQGIAQSLLTACLTPTTALALRVQDNNTPALTLYTRLNFHPA